MTLELGECTRVGDTVVAVLANRSVRPGSVHPALLFGCKHPAAILIHRNGTTTAFEPNGAPITLKELERRYPGRRVDFERQAAGETD